MTDWVKIATRVTGLAVIGYALYCFWVSIVAVVGVVTAVIFTLKYLDKQFQTMLPATGKVVIITGCDTGIGHESALALVQRDVTVVAGCLNKHSEGAKRLSDVKGITVVQLDVTDDDSIRSALQVVTKLCGEKGLWAVVNNAGFNRQSPVELTSMTTYQHVADVMLFGTIRVTKAFLPLIRRAKGRVVTVSSDRGMTTPALSSAYCVAKHSVEAFSDVLRQEMQQFSVKVSIIQPGHFGGTTAILNQSAIQAMRNAMETDLRGCLEEVQAAYGGQRVVETILKSSKASKDITGPSITPVVTAILQAVLNQDPSDRYPVHGTNKAVDWGIILGQVKPVVGETVLGWLELIVMDKARSNQLVADDDLS